MFRSFSRTSLSSISSPRSTRMAFHDRCRAYSPRFMVVHGLTNQPTSGSPRHRHLSLGQGRSVLPVVCVNFQGALLGQVPCSEGNFIANADAALERMGLP